MGEFMIIVLHNYPMLRFNMIDFTLTTYLQIVAMSIANGLLNVNLLLLL